jgi:hypothetical protein
MKRSCALGAMLLCAGLAIAAKAESPQQSSAAKNLSPIEQKLIAAENGFIAAVKKGDAAFVKNNLSDGYFFVGFDGQLHDRHETLDDLSGGGVDLQPYNMKVIPMGEDAGIVTYDVIMRVPAAEDQGPPPRYQHWSTVWVRQGDQWKIKFQQTTPTHWGDW